MAFYTYRQLLHELGAIESYTAQHKEVMDLFVYADATLQNPANKKTVFDALINLDKQWDVLKSKYGDKYVRDRAAFYKSMIKGFSGVEMESAQIKNAISRWWREPLYVLGSGIGYDIKWAATQAGKSLEEALKNAVKTINPFIDPETGKPSDLWKTIKWPLIVGAGSLALLLFMTYGLPMLKGKKQIRKGGT